MSSTPPGKREWTGPVGILITVITMGATLIVRFSSLEEAKDNHVKLLADHEKRIGDMERSSAQLERIHQLEITIVEMRSELKNLRHDIERLRTSRR